MAKRNQRTEASEEPSDATPRPHTMGLADEPGTVEQAPAEQAPAEKTAAEQLDDRELSEEAHGDNAPPLVPSRARQGDDGRPFCPLHNCLQVATGSKEQHTHYACPVPGCATKEKRARPQVKVPAEPQACPQRTCRDEKGKPLAYLEVDPRLSGVSHLHMVCPRCKFHVNAPRPLFNPDLYRQQRERTVESLATR
jgi:hypothetical protein